MNRRRGVARAVVLAVAGLTALSACASIPTASTVQTGGGAAAPNEPAFPINPLGPAADASPQELVAGFISASAAGVAGNVGVAKQFLTRRAAAAWDPSARVVIFGPGDVDADWDPATSTFKYTIPVAAYLDDVGRMVEVETGSREPIAFVLARGPLDEWRISEMPDGIVLSEANFSALFRGVPIAFASLDGEVEVPELRWLPDRSIETHAAQALITGPSGWLVDAIRTGIPATVELAIESVPVVDGVAQVGLREGAGGTLSEESLAFAQFEATLTPLPDVVSVNVEIGEFPIQGDGSLRFEPAPVPDATSVVLVNGRLGTWDGSDIRVVGDTLGILPLGAMAPAISYDGARAAFLAGGELHVSHAITNATVLVADVPAENDPPSDESTTVLAEGEALAPPSFDRHGWLWTGEIASEGLLLAISPAGEVVEVAVPWLVGRDMRQVRISRDGARIAVLSHVSGAEALDIAAVIRDTDGAPLSIGSPLVAGANLAPAAAITWVDPLRVAVLEDVAEGDTPRLFIVTVGGRTETSLTVPDAIGVAGGNGDRSLILITRSGALFKRSSSAWAGASGDESVLTAVFAGIAYAG